MKHLCGLDYRGNVRELRNLVERVLISNDFSNIDSEDVRNAQGHASLLVSASHGLKDATDDFERDYIARTIRQAGGNMTEAASRLGLERSHLYKKMKALGLERDKD